MEECWSPEPENRPSFTEITSRLRSMSVVLQPKGNGQAYQLRPSWMKEGTFSAVMFAGAGFSLYSTVLKEVVKIGLTCFQCYHNIYLLFHVIFISYDFFICSFFFCKNLRLRSCHSSYLDIWNFVLSAWLNILQKIYKNRKEKVS